MMWMKHPRSNGKNQDQASTAEGILEGQILHNHAIQAGNLHLRTIRAQRIKVADVSFLLHCSHTLGVSDTGRNRYSRKH